MKETVFTQFQEVHVEGEGLLNHMSQINTGN